MTTSFPQPIGMSASWDPELIKQAGEVTGTEARVIWHRHPDYGLSRWAPTVDLERDPRWGRSEECYSEDPCLAAAMAKAAVTGMQSTGVGSVAKHFCAQGETTGGVNASAARIGERELREIHFPSAKACCEAGI